MDQSEITPTVRRAFTLSFQDWEKQGVWPARSKIFVKLMREGRDLDEVLSRDFYPYASGKGSGVFELTLLGISEMFRVGAASEREKHL